MVVIAILPWIAFGLFLIWCSFSEHRLAQAVRAIWRSADRPGPRFATPLGLRMLGLVWVIGPGFIIAMRYFDPGERYPTLDLVFALLCFFGPLVVWRLVDGS